MESLFADESFAKSMASHYADLMNDATAAIRNHERRVFQDRRKAASRARIELFIRSQPSQCPGAPEIVLNFLSHLRNCPRQQCRLPDLPIEFLDVDTVTFTVAHGLVELHVPIVLLTKAGEVVECVLEDYRGIENPSPIRDLVDDLQSGLDEPQSELRLTLKGEALCAMRRLVVDTQEILNVKEALEQFHVSNSTLRRAIGGRLSELRPKGHHINEPLRFLKRELSKHFERRAP